jgi:S-DNA-T family DNA segregation ATPase FtsK/SpoIIIE
MKLKFTLTGAGRPPVDLVATIDAATTVGELADYLIQADPAAPAFRTEALGTLTLGLVGADVRALDSRTTVGESGLRSGATVTLTRAGEAYQDPQANAAAVVTVVDGPDRGREFGVRVGASIIGRERGSEIRLTDPLVSRQHARLNIADTVEVVDLGSANGIALGDSVVSRAVLRPGDTVRIGDSELSVRVLQAPRAGADAAAVAFVRPPRLDPHYRGQEFDAPEPPENPRTQRFPIVPLLAPVAIGALLYLITRSLTSIVFVALSPLMLVGSAVESRLGGRALYRRQLIQWRADVRVLVEQLGQAIGIEAVARNRENPPLRECIEAVRTGGPLLWTRRPDDPGFATFKLGNGQQPSRNQVNRPDAKRAPRELFAELVEAMQPYAVVADVPVLAQPAEFGPIGMAGPRPTMLAAARALITQAAALHSPAELVIAGFASSPSAKDWDWIKWLPHTSSVHSPLTVRQLAATSAAATRLASELEELLAGRSAREAAALPAILVLVEDDAPIEHSRLVELAEQGWRHGIYLVWLAGALAALPAACRTFVEVEHETSTGAVGFVHSGEQVAPLTIELLDIDTAADTARRLAPLIDSGARVDDDSDLPRAVSLLTLTGPQLASSPEAVIERWSENRSILTGPFAPEQPARRAGSLRAVIGQAAGEPFALDLRTDGPHALVGGTTGSGKSELLQAWILAMAAAHSPQRLTFLLVDYKGGSAFRDCVGLPHTIGLVTDLSPHLVRRALTSLSAELRYREHLLAQHSAKDLVSLERQGVTSAPPSLVIVVDEFAALVNEVPEFVDGVVNVAQRGRSLGLHLILATQRPAGVIKDNLRANTNLRVALRMADEADSTDVLGSPQAAFFDQSVPGRAVSKTGPGRLVPFQTGYAGGWTTDEPPRPELLVEELVFGAGRTWDVLDAADPTVAEQGDTDIKRIVDSVRAASTLAQLPTPRKPWLPELAAVYDLSDQARVPSRRIDTELVFGVRDDPAAQAQPTVAFQPDRDGNLAVYGTGGSGKSTLLRTLALAAGFTVRGGPCHVYGLDFGARGLAMLEELPHVGSIVSGADHERITRLLGWLRSLIDDRALRYSRANAGTITSYRTAADAPDEPRILLLVDGIAAFRQAYEVGDRARWFDLLVNIASDGRPVGVHVLLSADRPNAVPSALGSAVQRRIVLRMADAQDYAVLGLPADVLAAASPPGRGLLGNDEVQVALLGKEPDVGSQARMIRAFASSMVRAGASIAPPIQRLPDSVPLATLPILDGSRPVFGLSSDSLSAVGFEPSGSFLISGPPGAGRTTAVRVLAEALRRAQPLGPRYLFGGRRSALAALPLWTRAARGPADAQDLATALVAELSMAPAGSAPVAVFIENVSEFVGGPAEAALQDLAKACLAEDGLLVVEGETTTLSSSFGLLSYAKSSRAGLALQPDSADGTTVFRTNFPPRLNRAEFPPGRGLLVDSGQATVVQVADAGGE